MGIWYSFRIFVVLLRFTTADQENVTQPLFMVLPPSTWKTARTFCHLPFESKLDKGLLNKANELLQSGQYEAAWTGTRINYSRWIAFIGCSDYFTSTIQLYSATVKDCIMYCTVKPVTHLAYKDGLCFCLNDRPGINVTKNSCRKKCQNTSEFVCQGGPSALILEYYDTVTNLVITKSYIEEECIIVNPRNGTRTIHDCRSHIAYGCTASHYEVNPGSWHSYQNECLGRGHFVLHGKNVSYDNDKRWIWTAVFRIHAVTDGSFDKCDEAVTIRENGGLFVENCSVKLPFVCNVPDRTIETNVQAGSGLKILLTVLGILLFVLAAVVTTLAWKFWKVKIILQRLKQDNQSKAEVHLSSNKQNTSEKRNVLKQRHHSMASGDIPMIDGYLQPERYYSTVSEHRMIKGESKVALQQQERADRSKIEVHVSSNEQKGGQSRQPIDQQGYLIPDRYYSTVSEDPMQNESKDERIDVDHSEGSQNNSSVFDIIKTRFFRNKTKTKSGTCCKVYSNSCRH